MPEGPEPPWTGSSLGQKRGVERAPELSEDDLHALCEAAHAAIIEGGGFGWVQPPGGRA
ncbi:MAG: GNAT family N-acetyltransferase, partial [Acetobacteraceae bacterium]|nr:GNAT family N-acetyltransferase [Acetobacteraceae bacterium]